MGKCHGSAGCKDCSRDVCNAERSMGRYAFRCARQIGSGSELGSLQTVAEGRKIKFSNLPQVRIYCFGQVRKQHLRMSATRCNSPFDEFAGDAGGAPEIPPTHIFLRSILLREDVSEGTRVPCQSAAFFVAS